MTKATDSFVSDGDTILRTNNKYSAGTVKGQYINSTNDLIDITLLELGEDYLEIKTVIPAGLRINITYEILGTLATDNEIEFDLIERIVRLEKGLSDMFDILQAQKKAINNRVNITTFQAWIKLMEKKTGVKLVEENLSHIARELHKTDL